MTTLCDRDLCHAYATNELIISPWKSARVQPASYDLSLSADFLVPNPRAYGDRVSIRRSDERFPTYTAYTETVRPLVLNPGQFVLGRTEEWIEVGPALRARVEGKSTIGRLGLAVHCTAGYIDPGFKGHITLELFNMAPYSIELSAGAPVCQLAVEELSAIPERLYGAPGLGSHYQGQRGVTPPKL